MRAGNSEEATQAGAQAKASSIVFGYKKIVAVKESAEERARKNMINDYGVDINNYLKSLEEENRI